MMLTFDKEQISTNLKVFKDTNGRKPYIICNMKTFKMLPKNDKYIEIDECRHTIWINNKLEIPLNEDSTKFDYCGHTLFIDDKLEFGEVIFA